MTSIKLTEILFKKLIGNKNTKFKIVNVILLITFVYASD
jgi:hypothetical protein